MKQPPTGGLWSLAVDRPVATLMITIGVAIFGYLSFGQLPLTLMPELTYPTLTVRTLYEGAAPEEMEEEITRPLEEVLRTVEGVRAISSTSRAGLSDVELSFHWDTSMDFASQRVRERLDVLPLPEDAQRPLLLRYDPDLDPILRLSLHGEANQTRLRLLAQDFARELEKIEGVAVVKVRGGQEEIIRVDLDEERLAQLGLSVQEIRQRLASENVNLAGGQLEEGGVRYLVRTLNEFADLEELREMTVAQRGDQMIRLGAVGTVYSDTHEREVITHHRGHLSVELEIYKEADANIVEVARLVRDRALGSQAQREYQPPPKLKELPEEQRQLQRALEAQMRDYLAYELPQGVELDLLSDQSTFIQGSIDEVINTALLGGLCAILILFLFLRSPSSTLIIGLAIPLSAICTFAPMRLLGVDLNIMSLGGLALGIGMLVDNSVVVLESIFRCRQEGDGPRDAAIRGTREVGGAVIASTLTTTAVFFPIVFVEGVAGQLFGDLSLTVVFSLLASLVVALFVVPTLASRRLAQEEDQPSQRAPTRAPLKERLGRAARGWLRYASLQETGADLRSLLKGARARGWAGRLLRLPLWALFLTYLLLRTLLLFCLELLFLKLLAPSLGAVALLLRALVVGAGWLLGQALRPPAWLVGRGFDLMAQSYPRLLRAALTQRAMVLLIAAGLFGLGVWLFTQLGMELVPVLHQGRFEAELRLPVGTSLEQTEQKVAQVEARVQELPLVAEHSSVIGAEKSSTTDGDKGEHSATLHIELTQARDLERHEEDGMRQVRDILQQIPGLSFELERPTLLTLQTPLQVELRGYSLRQLRQAAELVEQELRLAPELTDLRSTQQRGFPEVQIRFDRARLASYGLDARQVAEVVRQKVQGVSPGDLRRQEKRVDIVLRAQRQDVQQVSDLQSLVVGYVTPSTSQNQLAQVVAAGGALPSDSVPIKLSAVAEVINAEGPAEIRRLDGQRAALLQANVQNLDLQTAAARVQSRVDALPLPSGVTAQVGGQNEELARARRSLLFALALAIFLVYLVMASQFESLVAPLVIIFTVPLAAVGVTGVLWLTHTPLSVVVFIGMIMLTGIVVNNAIVLVDYALQLQARGLPAQQALIEACGVRLRPVLITTLTTVLGLLPMALGLGEGAEVRQPMALTVIAGLVTSTALTLLVIPVVFDLTRRPAQGDTTTT